jgi:phage-related tail fiber protein
MIIEIGVADNGQPLNEITKCDYSFSGSGRFLYVRKIMANSSKTSAVLNIRDNIS